MRKEISMVSWKFDIWSFCSWFWPLQSSWRKTRKNTDEVRKNFEAHRRITWYLISFWKQLTFFITKIFWIYYFYKNTPRYALHKIYRVIACGENAQHDFENESLCSTIKCSYVKLVKHGDHLRGSPKTTWWTCGGREAADFWTFFGGTFGTTSYAETPAAFRHESTSHV